MLPHSTALQVLNTQTGRKRLLQLIGFLRVKDTKRVQVLGASNLKLNDIPAPLDFHRPRILPPRRQKKILNLVDLLRHCGLRVVSGVSEENLKMGFLW